MTAHHKADADFTPAITTQADALSPVSYAETAFTGEFDPEPARHTAGWARDLFENGTRCHEYLALLVSGEVGMLRDWKKMYNEPLTKGDELYEQRKETIYGSTLPGGLHYTGMEFSLVSWVETFRTFALLAALVVSGSLVLMTLFSFQSMVEWVFEDPLTLMLTLTTPVTIWWVLDRVVKSGWPARYSRPVRPYISFRRDLGVVQVRTWRNVHTIPFAELQAGAITTFDQYSKMKKLAFGVKHKHSNINVAMEGNLTATSPEGRWALCVRWELLQHYMDTTRPLPDIPMLEPYRHLDPTTRAWDKKHQRPRWVWMTMSDDDYLELMSDAVDAAETYPFAGPGHTPSRRDRERWQPAGDGQHWYQRG